MIQPPKHVQELEAFTHLDLAAFHLYWAAQPRFDGVLPAWDSKDATDMRTESRYLVNGALKRGDKMARLAVIERVAIVLATAAGDIWPGCDNQIHRGLSRERIDVLAAMRRQLYRHQARLVCAEVARFYEVDQDTPVRLAQIADDARTQVEKDKQIISEYRGRISKGEVIIMGVMRE